jgi:hypothetical protein
MDTLKRTLEYPVDIAGYERVQLGSDCPFDMGNLDCVRRVEEITVARAARQYPWRSCESAPQGTATGVAAAKISSNEPIGDI